MKRVSRIGHAMAIALIGVLLVPGSATAATRTFLPLAAEQTFTVPNGVTSIRAIAVGGRGGSGEGSPAAGGFGAVAIGDLAVVPGEVLYVNVGENGADGSTGGAGGFNGGGSSGLPAGAEGGGGGGASDVRTISRSVGTSPFSRLIVAAGGGGSGGASLGGAGGDAGEPGADATGALGGSPGGSSAGGTGGAGGCAGEPGGLAIGGDSVGGSCTGGPPGVGGGGGGGLYGGGGGGTSSSGAGGGGGSSGFAPGVTNSSVAVDNTGSPSVSLIFTPGVEPPPPPSFGASSGVSLKLAPRRIPARGPLRVRIRNRNGFVVTGELGAKRARSSGAAASGTAIKPRPFEVGAATSAKVDLRLPKKLRRVLARRGRLTVRLRAALRDPAANLRTETRKVTARLKSRR